MLAYRKRSDFGQIYQGRDKRLGKIFTDEIFAVRHIIYDRGNGTAADTQGFVYGIDGDSAFVTGYDPSVTLEDTRLSALIPSSADG